MRKIQEFLYEFQKDMNWEISGNNFIESRSSILNNQKLLTTEVGEIAEEFRSVFNMTFQLIDDGLDENEAFEFAKKHHKENIGKEISDCIAYLVKFANYLDIDLK